MSKETAASKLFKKAKKASAERSIERVEIDRRQGEAEKIARLRGLRLARDAAAGLKSK